MRLRGRNKVTPEFNMSSMTDIVFLLLIFFMIASTLVSAEAIDLLLPKSSSKTTQTKNISVSVDKDVNYYIDIAEIISDNYDKFDGFVVLTGSDTMSYTSSAISFMFENLQKPVIFTGSQLPIGDLRTDAKENLITSIHCLLYTSPSPRDS